MIKPKTLSQNEARQGSRRINASGFLFLCMTRLSMHDPADFAHRSAGQIRTADPAKAFANSFPA